MKVLDPGKVYSSVQNFTDIYLRLPGTTSNGQLADSECIRVRICDGRFALLIREVGIVIQKVFFCSIFSFGLGECRDGLCCMPLSL